MASSTACACARGGSALNVAVRLIDGSYDLRVLIHMNRVYSNGTRIKIAHFTLDSDNIGAAITVTELPTEPHALFAGMISISATHRWAITIELNGWIFGDEGHGEDLDAAPYDHDMATLKDFLGGDGQLTLLVHDEESVEAVKEFNNRMIKKNMGFAQLLNLGAVTKTRSKKIKSEEMTL